MAPFWAFGFGGGGRSLVVVGGGGWRRRRAKSTRRKAAHVAARALRAPIWAFICGCGTGCTPYWALVCLGRGCWSGRRWRRRFARVARDTARIRTRAWRLTPKLARIDIDPCAGVNEPEEGEHGAHRCVRWSSAATARAADAGQRRAPQSRASKRNKQHATSRGGRRARRRIEESIDVPRARIRILVL